MVRPCEVVASVHGELDSDQRQLSAIDSAEPEDAAERRAFVIDATLHGQRLDRALARLVPEFSRSYLQQLIEGGSVELAGRPAQKASAKVDAGAAGVIELRPTHESLAFRAEPALLPALRVIHQDAHLLVIDKPAGLVVHPAPGHWQGTLLNALLAHDPAAAQLPRAGIVHRLDRDTTGLMVVARTRAAMDALVSAIAARQVQRQYVALAHGSWQGASPRRIEAAIGRDPGNRLRMAVVDLARQSGKVAATVVECLGNGSADAGAAKQGRPDAASAARARPAPRGGVRSGTACAVMCTLETGRTHQIRVHMAAIGHPLVGDTLYGGRAAHGLARQGLHAFRLAFAHPASGVPLAFEAQVPVDLQQAAACWGLDYNFARTSATHGTIS
ncbi:MAG: RluA family pseudouridine synthase [Variovorax sp.]